MAAALDGRGVDLRVVRHDDMKEMMICVTREQTSGHPALWPLLGAMVWVGWDVPFPTTAFSRRHRLQRLEPHFGTNATITGAS